MSWKAFATGFMNRLSENIDERRDRAADWYDRQMTYAATEGRQKLSKLKQEKQATAQIASELKGNGVPDEVLIAAINEDPNNLTTMYKFWQKAAEKGISISEQQWRETFQIAGDMAGNDMTLGQVLDSVYEPFAQAVDENPEAVQNDPASSMFARAFGYDSYERANRKLDETEVFGGYTAGQLLSIGDERGSPLGGVGVTYDPTKFAKDTKELDSRVYERIWNEWDSLRSSNEVQDMAIANVSESIAEDASPAQVRAAQQEEANRIAAEELLGGPWGDQIYSIPEIARFLPQRETDEGGGTGAPVTDETMPEGIPQDARSVPQQTKMYEGQPFIIKYEDGNFYYGQLNGKWVGIPKTDYTQSNIEVSPLTSAPSPQEVDEAVGGTSRNRPNPIEPRGERDTSGSRRQPLFRRPSVRESDEESLRIGEGETTGSASRRR